jgi:adenylate cyclase class 2
MRTHKNREVEVKLRVADLAALRKRLRQLRARKGVRVHEMNTLYDTPRGRFLKRGTLLRLRLQAPQDSRKAASQGLLTYKGPSLSPDYAQQLGGEGTRAHGRASRGTRYKVREELEMQVPEPGRLRAILLALGLVPAFQYEKFRTLYTLSPVPRVEIELDETPIGVFVELEGPPRAIDRAARLLGYGPDDYISWSYRGLYLDYCHRRGIPPGQMLFPGCGPKRAVPI